MLKKSSPAAVIGSTVDWLLIYCRAFCLFFIQTFIHHTDEGSPSEFRKEFLK